MIKEFLAVHELERPVELVAIVFVPVPVATQIFCVGLHATPKPVVVKIVAPMPIQLLPFELHARVFVPAPVATHMEPFHAAAQPAVVKGWVP